MSGASRHTSPPDQVQADAAVEGNRTSRWALWASVIFSSLALLVSIGSLVVAIGSLAEQRSINEEQRRINQDQRRAMDDQRRAIDDQIRANDENRTDELMEYAIRVSWWVDPYADFITVQNRSTVPIRDVTLRYKAVFGDDLNYDWENIPVYDSSPIVIVGLIPPCTSFRVDGAALYGQYVGSPPDYGIYGLASMAWVRVDFIDVHGSWSVGPSGEQPQTLDVEDRIEFVEGAWPISRSLIQVAPASDCGSG